MDTIHRGFLIKEGGEGHQYKNEKKRWFVLKDMFLFYHSGVPTPTKNMIKLKGLIYLPGSKIKDNPKGVADTFVMVSAKKEYVISSVSANPTADIMSWRNSMEYAIENSGALEGEEGEVTTGWLMKKGGKGHTYQNWKKRWFVMRGNIVFYYEDREEEMEKRGWANMEKLKGFIEISMITDIDADVSSDGNGFQFIVTVNNDKSYIFATKSLDEKNMWLGAMRRRIERFSKRSLQVALNTCSQEVFVKSGELKRHLAAKRLVNNYFVLTNVNLRVYGSRPDLVNISENWGKNMIACIPLLGCSVQSSDDSEEWDLKQNEMAIIEIQGHAYVLETSSVQERIDWVLAMKTSARNLAKSVIENDETIRLTCNASDKNDHNAGYTILTIDKSKLQLKYLMLKKTVTIPFDKLKLVFLQPGFLFCLKYAQGEKAKQLKMKCGNAHGIFDAVEAIFELIQKNNPDRLQRHSTGKALAHPSITATEVAANTKPSKPPRRMTKEMILTARQDEESALNIAAALASSSSSSSLPPPHPSSSSSPSFSDFHYDAAPSSTLKKQKPLRNSKKKSKHSSNNLHPDPSTAATAAAATTTAPHTSTSSLSAALPPPQLLPAPPTGISSHLPPPPNHHASTEAPASAVHEASFGDDDDDDDDGQQHGDSSNPSAVNASFASAYSSSEEN